MSPIFILRFGLVAANIVTATIGFSIMRRSSVVGGNLRTYLLILFAGFIFSNLCSMASQIGLLYLGWAVQSSLVAVITTASKFSELAALSIFVLYLLGLINGGRNSDQQ